MRIALEAMGDFPLDPLVAGAVAAARADKYLRISFLGDAKRLEQRLTHVGKLGDRLHVVPCSQYVLPDEDPRLALRVKPDASVARCWQLLMEQKVDAMVTHAPPPAVVAAGLRYRRFLPGVRHPTLAAAVRTRGSTSILADAGAHPEPSAEHLYQSGVMAGTAAELLLQAGSPTIGVLVEDATADDPRLANAASRLFLESPYRSQFMGTVSTSAVEDGAAGVAVCTSRAADRLLAKLPTTMGDAGAASPASTAMTGQHPVRCLRGGFLLGMEGACVLTFGQTDPDAVQEALHWAAAWIASELNRQMSQRLMGGPLGGFDA